MSQKQLTLNYNHMKKLFLVAIFALLSAAYVSAQMGVNPLNLNWTPVRQEGIRADPDVFLQGIFIELGIEQYGSCGTVYYYPPAGYHNYIYFHNGMGFVADYDLNGWAVGTPPYSGDYILPGYPYEGWQAEFNYGANEYTFKNCGAAGQWDVPQTSLTNTSSGPTNSALWVGTATGGEQSLQIEQNFHFKDFDSKFFIDVTLTNVGPDPLVNVEYARGIDPDQEADIGGTIIGTYGYKTSNWVISQPSGSSNRAEVIAVGMDFGVPITLRLEHPNARAHVVPSSLVISNPDEPLDFTNAPTNANPYVRDVGIAVAVRFPLLNPGQSETFTVTYLLSTTEVVTYVPISNWALALMIGLIVIFTVIRFRRMN
jgi:hypothetical protein